MKVLCRARIKNKSDNSAPLDTFRPLKAGKKHPCYFKNKQNMNAIELKIGTVLTIQNKVCIVKEGRACSKCEYQKLTYHKVSSNGTSLKCGTKYGGNTSDFICSKHSRSDKKNVFFEAI